MMAIASDGNLLMRMGENMVMDMDTGDLHIISLWSNDDEDDAFSLSDAYIRRAELLSDHNGILNLQYHMLIEFTEQVEKLRRGENVTKLSLDVANYVRHHLSETISVEKMAQEFFLSRPYLSAKFKKETGQTLTDFILNEKTEEAKRLIRYTDKSLPALSAYPVAILPVPEDFMKA